MCGSKLKFYHSNEGPLSLGLEKEDKLVIAGNEPCGLVVELGKNVSNEKFYKVR